MTFLFALLILGLLPGFLIGFLISFAINFIRYNRMIGEKIRFAREDHMLNRVSKYQEKPGDGKN